MKSLRILLAFALTLTGTAVVADASPPAASNGGVTLQVSDGVANLDNFGAGGTLRKSVSLETFTELGHRYRGVVVDEPVHEFSVGLADQMVTSDLISVDEMTVTEVDGGLRVTRTGGLEGVVEIERTIEMYGSADGTLERTTMRLIAPLAVSGYALGAARFPGGKATVHALRAGADWRYDSGWDPFGIGDDRRGPWRVTTTAGPGEDLKASGEWLEIEHPAGNTALIMQRHDYASSQGRYLSGVAESFVDLTRDIAYTGPIEEQVHVENPTDAPVGRARVIQGEFAAEPVWRAFGRDSDEVAETFNRMIAISSGDYQRRVVFNTNNVDSNRISTGAKDDVDFATFVELARAAREAGVDTFVLDDGWQAISGDWCPDSPECPEPRRDRDPVRFGPRFPDAEFRAVREFLADDPSTPTDDADMDLGLWFTPMEFHPASKAYRTNPQWACAPVGNATAGLSTVQPDSSSNEAGLGVWNPLAWGVNPEDPTQPMRAIDWIESRIARAITVFGARYFKFDFLVWLDCGGAEPVDQYQYREAFLGMLDRLRADHPDVLFTIDETNDYRLFPYESTARGATWFQNGSPRMSQALHNIWNLSPFVPGYSLGQGIASRGDEIGSIGIDALMSAGMTSHLTIWRDLRSYSPAQRQQLKRWNDFYRNNAQTLSAITYRLLEDPLLEGWTALQSWNPDLGEGWFMAYRQQDARSQVDILPRALSQRAGDVELTAVDPATGGQVPLGTVTVADLMSDGLEVSAGLNGYSFVRYRLL
ncbi:MAG: alpha-galactosidase [Actinomycetota bacterium]